MSHTLQKTKKIFKYLARFFIIFSAAMTDFIKKRIYYLDTYYPNKNHYYSTIMSFYYIRSRERAKYEAVLHCSVLVYPVYNRANTGGSKKLDEPADKSKIENRSQNNFFFFCSRIINLSFNGLAYNTREHFAHC